MFGCRRDGRGGARGGEVWSEGGGRRRVKLLVDVNPVSTPPSRGNCCTRSNVSLSNAVMLQRFRGTWYVLLVLPETSHVKYKP